MKTVEPRDFRVALALSALWPIAWLLPQRFWGRACSAITAYKTHAPWERYPDAAALTGTLRDVAEDPSEVAAIIRDMDWHRHMLRLQILKLLSPGGWHPPIDVGGVEHLDAARSRGRGAILWMSHFIYNGLVGKIALQRQGYDVHHVSRPEHGFSKTWFGIHTVNRVRVRAEDRFLAGRILIDRRSRVAYMKRILDTLSANGVVSITAGAWEGRRVVDARIMGQVLTLANGAPAIACSTGAALLPVVGYLEPGHDAFRVEILPEIALDADAGKARAIAAAASSFLERIEPYVRKYPGQWRSWSKLRDADRATSDHAPLK